MERLVKEVTSALVLKTPKAVIDHEQWYSKLMYLEAASKKVLRQRKQALVRRSLLYVYTMPTL